MFASWNARAAGLAQSAGEAIEAASTVGFEGVDLLVRDIVESGVDATELRRRMDDLGLRGGAWPLPVDWKGGDGRFRNDLRQLPRYARVAATLGLTRTGTWILPRVITGPESRTPESAVQRTLEFHRGRLDPIAAILGDHGIGLGLEIIGPARAIPGDAIPFIRGYDELLGAFRELHAEHPNVGVLLDAFHLHAAGEDPEAGLSWGPDSIVWAHVADAANPDRSELEDHERALPGETGLIDCRAFLESLRIGGYSGPVTAEPLSGSPSLRGLSPVEAARRTLDAIRDVWPACG